MTNNLDLIYAAEVEREAERQAAAEATTRADRIRHMFNIKRLSDRLFDLGVGRR